MSFAPETEALGKPESLLRVPVGLASPLWGLFAGAAMTGATWWWMTRWARPQNLEALIGSAAEAEAAIAPETVALAAPVADTAEAVIEATAEPVTETLAEAAPEPSLEAVAELTPEPVLEALAEAPDTFEPIGGESAPISPLVAALSPEIAGEAAPKLKKKLAAPKPD